MEPEDSLRMGDKHLDTIPETESDEFIKSSVENLVPNPNESEDLSDSECDVPVCDDFTTFSNLLFDADDDFSSSDNESFSDEDISKEIYSNPLFDDEIISIMIDPHHFNAESDLIESLLNHDSWIISSSSKIDYLLDEFSGELILPKSIPLGLMKSTVILRKKFVLSKNCFVDYEDKYQGKLQEDSQEDKLTTAMMLLARASTKTFSTPNNNRIRTSSNTSNQAAIQDGRVDIQTKNVGFGGNDNKHTRRQNKNQAFNAGIRNDERNQIVQRVPRNESNPTKANVYEQMLLAMKDEAESNLNNKENDFMLDTSNGEEKTKELTAAVMSMAQIQQVDGNGEIVSSYDAKAISELDELFKHVNQKTYAYADVRAQNQDLLVKISELKNKLKTVAKGRNVITKFDKSETLETFLCVTSLPKNIAIKAKKVSNSKIVDSGCLKFMTGNLQLLRNFIEKFMGTVPFENDHFAALTGYGDYVQGNLMICHVNYVEGLGYNLFLVKQFCNGDLEVAFCSNTCYIWNLEGDDLLTGSHDSNLYIISISKMAASSPVCLMSRATSTKSWLWHRRLSHLNFSTINF
nr:integrase, catalytic region, zinc finger, CCHC-type, peptidase aspartic, catalytic [Tanacetum cinerariifolium]